ncbi:gamma-glutamyl-gamma-aminobutyrate hydrolase family protein [Lacticaseibacillus zhaodongensis]|uniref:gamma-glutamyl-gamma-aminobutyrate hydrolase family protein n=1 Tax=Lacticaseibacillus zhaodongensis TaxID=2668065 RepID=UPI0012D361EA|nr:gamma-glutamyl-gamma-aminobutyrate hydrolase family protein [Lacticaseibacillus zhaodongensis]
MKPIIALSSDEIINVDPQKPDDYPVYAPHDVKEGVLAAGGIPIILPFPDDSTQADALARAMVHTFDGLILPGGPDVNPIRYGEEPIPEVGMTLDQKDVFELALIKATVAAHKPIFGICRGIQIANVALGGTVYQDLAAQDPDCKIQHAQATRGHWLTHHVDTVPGSRVNALLGDRFLVNSRHHEAVRAVAPGLRVTATAPDGVIEALESTADDGVLLVQWHPENLWYKHPEHLRLFTDLVERAQRAKAET